MNIKMAFKKVLPENIEYLRCSEILSSRDIIFCMIIVLIVFIGFSHSLKADFIMIDDDLNIYKNPHFQEMTQDSFLVFWKAPYENLFIPVTYNLWAILCIISNAVYGRILPVLFHASNMLFHSVNSVLVFFILRHKGLSDCRKNNYKTPNISSALFASLFFAVHPLTVESVAWVSGMKDILFTFFSLMSVFLFLKKDGCEWEKWLYYSASSLFFLMACLSKPTAIIVPFFISVLTLFIYQKSFRSLIYMVPWFLISIIFIFFSQAYMPPPPSGSHISLFQRPFLACYTFVFYLNKILFPWILIHDYGKKPEIVMNDIITYLLPFFIITLIVIYYFLKKNVRRFIGLILLFGVSILPYSGLIAFEFQRISTVADRYAYFAVFSFSIALNYILSEFSLPEFRWKQLISNILMTGIIVLFTVKTLFQVTVWQNDVTLCTHTIKYNKYSEGSYINLGIKMASISKFEDAVMYYRNALEINPDNTLGNYNLGIAYACTKKFKDADSQYMILKRIDPVYAEKLNNAIFAIKASL